MFPTSTLFYKMKILPIEYVVSLQTGTFMHDCYNGSLPSPLQNNFNLNCNIHSYNTRNNSNFHPPLFRTELSKTSIFYQGPILWNNLSPSLKNSVTARKFRNNYKCYLLQQWELILCTFNATVLLLLLLLPTIHFLFPVIYKLHPC